MDYMTDYLLRRNGHELHKFEIQESRAWEEAFYYKGTRLPTLESKAQDMIFSNRAAIDFLLNQLVAERLGGSHSCYTDSCGQELAADGAECTTTCDFGRTCQP